jgi:hypothetical protein
MEVMQTDHLNEVYCEEELTILDIATVETDYLRELLMDLPIVEKPLLAILMNNDNQTVIVKRFKGQYEVIKTHQKMVNIYQENEKL